MQANELIVLALEKAARLCGPLLQRRLARFALRLLPDLPVLAGPWTADFDDPALGGKRRRVRVHATLTQFGPRIAGIGHLESSPRDTFAFRGTIRRNVLFGTYRRSDTHVLAGTGSFVLKIEAHSRRMRGRCLWFDGLLDDAWASPYLWKRGD